VEEKTHRKHERSAQKAVFLFFGRCRSGLKAFEMASRRGVARRVCERPARAAPASRVYASGARSEPCVVAHYIG